MSGTVDGKSERFEKPWFITFVMWHGKNLDILELGAEGYTESANMT